MLKFNSGNWTWTADRCFPSWTSVGQAKIYTAPEFAALRSRLFDKRFRVVSAPGSTADVVVVEVESPVDDTVRRLIRMYSPRRCANVPAAVASLTIKMALHHCQPLQPAPDHVAAALSSGALTVLWGSPSDVQYAVSRLPAAGADVGVVEVTYFVRTPQAAADYVCTSYVLRICGHRGFFKKQVCVRCALSNIFLWSRCWRDTTYHAQ
jgi:hypothetical protein